MPTFSPPTPSPTTSPQLPDLSTTRSSSPDFLETQNGHQPCPKPRYLPTSSTNGRTKQELPEKLQWLLEGHNTKVK